MVGLSARARGSAPTPVTSFRKVARAAALIMALMPAQGFGGAPETSRAPSLCARGETSLFSCPIGGKLVSVCGRAGGGATYRYGRPGRVEMRATDLRFAQRGYSGGGEQQIWFANSGYRYVIYDRVVRTAFGADGKHDPQASAGLMVQHGGRTVSNRGCGGGIASRAAGAMPRGDFVEH